MEFRVGDPVVHWTYGLGEVIRLEEHSLSGQKALYYVVQLQDMTIWVPADEKVMGRLRSPTPELEFDKLFAILSGPGESLPDDRFERRTQLQEVLKDGRAESLCIVIRDLSSYQQRKTLNDNDKIVLKRASDSLIGEWGFSLSISPAQAAADLHRLLGQAQQSIPV